MATVTEILDADMNAWIPGTRFFKTENDDYFVIDADLGQYPDNLKNYIQRSTCVLYCNPDATVTDLTPDFVFDPGTTPEDAIQQMGHTLDG